MQTITRRAAAIAALGLLLAGCTTGQAIVASVRPPPPDPKTQMRALETRIYALVEAEREKIDPKAKPLARDKELAGVARRRSADMAAKRYMAHRAPDGQTSASIIMAEDANFQGLLGENIAAQYYTKEGGVDVDTYAKRFVDTWLASKSHRDNLAFPDYTRTGIGAAVNGDTVYVTQLFSADLGLKPPPKGAPDQRKITTYPDPGSAKPMRAPRHDDRLRDGKGVGLLPGKAPAEDPAKEP